MVRKRSPAARRGPAGSKTGRSGKKFHGAIEVDPPDGGAAIPDGTRVLIALREVRFGDLPDGRKNEVALVASVETDKEDTGTASGTLRVDLFRYVPDDAALNISDLVLYSGAAHRHLTFRCAITELDQSAIDPMRSVISSGLGLARDLAGPGAAAVALGGLPHLVSGLLAFNTDDQILVLNHSFYLARVPPAGRTARSLKEGIYTFRKVPAGGRARRAPQVTLRLEVMATA